MPLLLFFFFFLLRRSSSLSEEAASDSFSSSPSSRSLYLRGMSSVVQRGSARASEDGEGSSDGPLGWKLKMKVA